MQNLSVLLYPNEFSRTACSRKGRYTNIADGPSLRFHPHVPKPSTILGLSLILVMTMMPTVIANDGYVPWFQAYQTSPTYATSGQEYSTNVFAVAADYHSPTLTVTYNYGDGSANSMIVTGTSWLCTLGDGGCYTYNVPLYHTWTTAGSYTMTITLTDTQGGTAAKSFTVSVTDPTCTYGGTYPNCNPPPCCTYSYTGAGGGTPPRHA